MKWNQNGEIWNKHLWSSSLSPLKLTCEVSLKYTCSESILPDRLALLCTNFCLHLCLKPENELRLVVNLEAWKKKEVQSHKLQHKTYSAYIQNTAFFEGKFVTLRGSKHKLSYGLHRQIVLSFPTKIIIYCWSSSRQHNMVICSYILQEVDFCGAHDKWLVPRLRRESVKNTIS